MRLKDGTLVVEQDGKVVVTRPSGKSFVFDGDPYLFVASLLDTDVVDECEFGVFTFSIEANETYAHFRLLREDDLRFYSLLTSKNIDDMIEVLTSARKRLKGDH